MGFAYRIGHSHGYFNFAAAWQRRGRRFCLGIWWLCDIWCAWYSESFVAINSSVRCHFFLSSLMLVRLHVQKPESLLQQQKHEQAAPKKLSPSQDIPQ